jgi:hypothetical protein
MRGDSLRAILEAAATELEAAESRPTATGVEWLVDGIVFAVAGDTGAEFRLTTPVAAAALRTPDTVPSSRGSDWVAFAPAMLDQHAIDRATAWLASAWRRAERGADA